MKEGDNSFYTVEAGRQIHRDGKPCVALARQEGCSPVFADDLAHELTRLLNARLTSKEEAVLRGILNHIKQNEKLQDVFAAVTGNKRELFNTLSDSIFNKLI